MLLSKYTVRDCKKLRFIEDQEPNGWIGGLGIKTI